MVKDLCFEIIERCPNECKFCSSNSCISKDKIICFEDFKRVIDYFMSQGGIGELSLSGGEPFLHPDLFEMIKYSKSLGIRTVIFTSGVKYKKKPDAMVIKHYKKEMNEALATVEKYEPWNESLKNNVKSYYDKFINPPGFSEITKDEFSMLKELGLDKVVFDYQAYELETDRYLMGRDNLKHYNLLDSLINAEVCGLDIDIHFVPMKPNYKEIGDILEMLDIGESKSISILNFVPQGRGLKNVDDLMLNNEELREFFEILERNKKYFKGNIRIGIPLQGENTHLCNAGLEKLDIKFDGTILPCPAFKELDKDTMKRYGIKYYNIYENLESVKTPGGTRMIPLCQKVYKK